MDHVESGIKKKVHVRHPELKPTNPWHIYAHWDNALRSKPFNNVCL